MLRGAQNRTSHVPSGRCRSKRCTAIWCGTRVRRTVWSDARRFATPLASAFSGLPLEKTSNSVRPSVPPRVVSVAASRSSLVARREHREAWRVGGEQEVDPRCRREDDGEVERLAAIEVGGVDSRPVRGEGSGWCACIHARPLSRRRHAGEPVLRAPVVVETDSVSSRAGGPSRTSTRRAGMRLVMRAQRHVRTRPARSGPERW